MGPWRVWTIIGWLACFALVGCRSPTEISVEISTDEECGKIDSGAGIATGQANTALTSDSTSSTSCTPSGAVNDLGSIVLVPSGERNDLVSIRVTVGVGVRTEDCVMDAGGCIVARRRLRYVPHEPLHLPIVLGKKCLGVPCAEDKTCVEGACYPALIEDNNACATPGVCDEQFLVPDGGAPDATIADAAADAADAAPTVGLSNLTLSAGALSPAFSASTLGYSVRPSVVSLGTPFTITPTYTGGTVTIGGASVAPGAPSPAIALKLLTPTAIDVTFTPSAGAPVHYAIVVPSVQEAYAKASNTHNGDNFGSSVALSGDTLAVGSIGESGGASGVNGDQADASVGASGAVYVFARVNSAWTQQAYVKASNTAQTNAFFGYSVALSGDTLAVGALDDPSNATGINGNQTDTSAPSSGAVYVFTRSGITWSQQAYVKASNTRANSGFGSAVALSGDTLAVSSNQESSNASGINGDQSDTSAAGSGAVYVFTRVGTTWSQQAYVKASNTRTTAYFGTAIAISGDTLAVGAQNESSSATGINGNQGDTYAPASGAAYVFTRTSTTWSQQAYLKASDTRAGANFGISIALSGDTLAVGSQFESSNATGINGNQADASASSSGAAYVFIRTSGIWTQQAYLKASNSRASANFGSSIALFGDALAVGAQTESSNATGVDGNQMDTSAPGAGAAYLFTRKNSTWTQQAYVKASNTRPSTTFGRSIALTDTTLAVGSTGEASMAVGINGNQTDTTAGSSGAVYVVR